MDFLYEFFFGKQRRRRSSKRSKRRSSRRRRSIVVPKTPDEAGKREFAQRQAIYKRIKELVKGKKKQFQNSTSAQRNKVRQQAEAYVRKKYPNLNFKYVGFSAINGLPLLRFPNGKTTQTLHKLKDPVKSKLSNGAYDIYYDDVGYYHPNRPRNFDKRKIAKAIAIHDRREKQERLIAKALRGQ